MKSWSNVAVIVGLTAGAAGILGYWYDPAKEVTLVVALVCGMAAAFYQLSVRDFLSRIQSQIDRAADRAHEDGGEMLDENRDTRDRVAALARTQLITAALAPSFAAARSIYALPFLSGAAFAFAIAAVVLALLLDGASRQYSRLVETERSTKAESDYLKGLAKERKPVADTEKIAKENPNLGRYTGAPVEARHKH